MSTLDTQNTLITATDNNRATLLETVNRELSVLKQLAQPIFSAIEQYEAKDQEQQEITARIAEIDKALLTITEKAQGVKLTKERRELQDELAFTQTIKKNRLPDFIKDLTALAIPYYKQEPNAYQALKALYIEVYDTATPQTVSADFNAMLELRRAKVGTGNQVQIVLKEYGVLQLGNKAVQDTDGTRVIIGNNSSLDLVALETLNKAVEALTKDLSYRGGLYR